MKKIIALVLALVLVFSMAGSCLAESSTSSAVKFDPSFTDGMKYDADKWMSSSFNRAAVTVMLYCDLILAKLIDSDNYTLVDSMVAEKDGIISVAILGKTSGTLVILYAPLSGGIASYMTLSSNSKTVIEKILKEGGNSQVYTNSSSDLKTVLEVMKEALNKK